MSSSMHRREFLGAAAAAGAAYLAARTAQGLLAPPPAGPAEDSAIKLQTFDYQRVTLGKGRWQEQFQAARDFYFGVSDDDILNGYRKAAGMPAPGKPLGGWCATTSDTVLGQWFQGMTRMAQATGDAALKEKAVRLFTEWAKTIGPDGNSRMRHYPFEKLVGGLVDLKKYAGHDPAVEMLDKVVDVAIKSLDRTRTPASPRPWGLHSGTPGEWYTMGENQYRAFELTGKAKYKEFGDVWKYDAFWNKFLETADPKDAYGVHAYSHVNSFSSCAMAYAVTGEAKFLQILRNAYDFMQNRQTYATGGFGPVERLMPSNGNLGVALEDRQNSCETPCCSWAAFKMARYLMTFTAEARYGDWIERLLYNGIGAALPITENGKNFYYADYRLAGGIKNYARSTYTCCSGTYIQAVAEYVNLIYFKDAGALYVNLYVPSEVTWDHGGNKVKVTQATNYPEGEVSTFTVSVASPTRFVLNFRVPGWCSAPAISVNGTEITDYKVTPGTWSGIEREWKEGDKLEVRIPLAFRYVPVDKEHPDRVAVVRGPVVMVQDAAVHEPIFGLPKGDEELNKQLVASRPAGQYALLLTGRNAADPTAANGPANGPAQAGAKFMPFYAIPEVNSYRMYFDRREEPKPLW
ncbi:MAG TPA: beta-L-arabinofuranosidase domain-containing protein [Phycisphaerae bacterium]|nr:beta-L-arabinofuranosidase domain-containing protein [Phycisphaerae bacterium]